MLLLIVYEQWRGIYSLGEHFNVVARGRKFFVLILVYLGSTFLDMCSFPLMSVRQLILLVFFRRRDWLSWGYWCPCRGHQPGCGYTAGRRCLPIVPWLWLFPGTLWPDIVPYQTLTKWSGCPTLCVIIPIYILQSKVCLPSVNRFSFERWLLFFEARPRPCSLVCHVLFLSMSPVWWLFPPICAPGRGLRPSAIVSLWRF